MDPLSTYDLKEVNLIVGGRDISGYGEGGGIEFESSADVLVPLVGATGSAVVSRTNNHAALCTITVGEWTQSYKDLAELMQEQQGQAPIEALDFLMEDPLNGDEISDQFAAFVQRPLPNKASTAGERTFQLFLPNAFAPEKAKFGTAN